jgi:lysophospholipase L1-like esterase
VPRVWVEAATAQGDYWIGTWAAAAQPSLPRATQTFRNQTLRLIVHTSVGGTKVRIRLSNTYGDQPLLIGGAHIADRTSAADIDLASDRVLTFGGRASTTIPPHTVVVSDPLSLEVRRLSDLAISIFLPASISATTSHLLALQTSYVSPEIGDVTAAATFPVATTIASWPFLTGVDVWAPGGGAAIVAFGSSTTDGDGATRDANQRWPDVLAMRLQKRGDRHAQLGVLNLGIIGNRLLFDSPRHESNPFGRALGDSGLDRFERDVLGQSGVRYLIVGLGINDIVFPAFPFTSPKETVTAQQVIAGYRQLTDRAHARSIHVIGTTIPPFEHSTFPELGVSFYTPERETVRREINAWIRQNGGFDAVVDFDIVLRDPSRPTQLLPRYDKGDHLHVNDAGNNAVAEAIPLTLFARR